MGIRTPLSDEVIDRDVDVSWWVTPDAYYSNAYEGLAHVLATEFPLWKAYYSNDQIPGTIP
jgi:hypothetical protein